MLRRLIPVTLLSLAAIFSFADTTHLGIYMQGSRVGDATFSDTTEVLNGKTLKRGDSSTKISTGMMGGALSVEINSTSWSEMNGRPVRMLFVTKSGGRTMTVDANFGEIYADVTLQSGGPKQKKRLLIPTDGPIVDDPMPMVLKGEINAKTSFYELRPDTVSFSKDQAINRGPSKVKVGDKTYDATLVDVIDSMSTMHVYVGGKGNLIKAEGPLGLEMIPEELGSSTVSDENSASPDLATASSIKPDKPVANPGALKFFKFHLTAPDANRIPNDEHQTAIKTNGDWQIAVHPVDISKSVGTTITLAAKQQPNWVEPDTYIPSDSPRFKALAKQIIGKQTRVRGAALAVQNWIANRMRPNPGIGVLRDANEVLSSKEGVCRDYAILAATLLRAGGVPTRMCSGLVSWDGTFYYHAWVEVWNGKSWIGIDPTVTDPQISAAHIKLADGNIATAFQFPVLDKVSIKVEEAVSR